MSLVLGMREGDRVFVGDDPVTLEEIMDTQKCRVSFKGQEYTLEDKEPVKIMDNVYLGLGLSKSCTTVRLLFVAPKWVTITREGLYKEHHAH